MLESFLLRVGSFISFRIDHLLRTGHTMNSQHSARARRSKQLQELLDGKHFKQALNLCEKSFKKGDKSEDLLVCQTPQDSIEIPSLPCGHDRLPG